MHILIFVKSSYFANSDNYISQNDWTDLWKKAAKLDYTPVVNIKAVKPQSKNELDPNGMKKSDFRNCKISSKTNGI